MVRAVVKSLQLVTLARLLQASAESLNLGIEIGRGAYVGAISVALHILEIIMSASLFLNCSKGLDLVHTTHGADASSVTSVSSQALLPCLSQTAGCGLHAHRNAYAGNATRKCEPSALACKGHDNRMFGGLDPAVCSTCARIRAPVKAEYRC